MYGGSHKYSNCAPPLHAECCELALVTVTCTFECPVAILAPGFLPWHSLPCCGVLTLCVCLLYCVLFDTMAIGVATADAEAAAMEMAESIETAAKLALACWLKSVDPPRSVPRAGDFFDKLVKALWDSDVRSGEDLARLPVQELAIGGTPGQRTFVLIAHTAALAYWPQNAAATLPTQHALPVQSEADDNQLQSQLQLFERLVANKKPDPVVHVDMQTELEQLGMSGLADDFKPDGELTDKLMAQVEKLSRTKKVPFVNVKLSNFVPHWAREPGATEEREEDEESETLRTLQRVMGVKQEKRTLTFLQCLQGLQRYIIAAASCKQFSLAAGWSYLGVVMQVATRAGAEGKRHTVAVIYDQLAREKWATAAYHAGMSGSFQLEDAMGTLDEKVYSSALRATEIPAMLAKPQHSFPAKSRGKGAKFDGECRYCGKMGHRKIDCNKFKEDQAGTKKRKWGGTNHP